jgi:hypothetical protein
MRLDSDRLGEIAAELATKPKHEKVRALLYELLTAGLGAASTDVQLEKAVPEAKGRLDGLLGRTVFEIKSDLARELHDAEHRLPSYLEEREQATGQRYVGIATDGFDWRVYERREGTLALLREFRTDPKKPRELLVKLDSAVAIAEIIPDAESIKTELGRDSPAYRRVEADLAALWAACGSEPDVALKRQLWRQLLALVYGRDIDDDALWFQHTFLVIVAKAIAAKVVGIGEPEPDDLLSGLPFVRAGITGAVESDFFDWVLARPEGVDLVRRVVRQVGRFRLSAVETDVLKVLYESLIDPGERHDLGEYYTPDWLAAKVCRAAVANPLRDRVIDPACGSGTFLFHAVRMQLAAAAHAKTDIRQRAQIACGLIAGIDIHPVSIIIARVTFLLALGEMLSSKASSITIPVYLGDALQLNVRDMFMGEELVVIVPPKAGEGEHRDLHFPKSVCEFPDLFDQVLETMRVASESGMRPQAFDARIKAVLAGKGKTVLDRDLVMLRESYEKLDALRREGRDTIWSYVARNLSRPLHLSSLERRADVVVGNPPWLAFRFMSREFQARFKEVANGERVYVGGKLATQADLSALFFAKSVALYVREGGTIAFVMPLAALTRGQFEKFRTGAFHSKKVQFTEAWTFDEDVRPLFPVPSCVLFAKAGRGLGRPTPKTVTAYKGRLPVRDAHEDMADRHLRVALNAPAPSEASYEAISPYRGLFRQGATLVPRMLCLVEKVPAGRLGGDPRAPLVKSRRSTQEKQPWKKLNGLEGQIESEFLRPIYLGESILPFRAWRPAMGVISASEDGDMIDAEMAASRGVIHLHGWMSQAEATWNEYADSEMSLVERWDYHKELSSQFPVRKLRVVYAKAGTLPAAALIDDDRAIIDHMLYWMPVSIRIEGLYVASILGSETARQRVQGLQAKGQFGARHFDKVMFTLPIPSFNSSDPLHNALAAAGAQAEGIAAKVDIPDGLHFQTARRRVREALAEAGVSAEIDALVPRLLDG